MTPNSQLEAWAVQAAPYFAAQGASSKAALQFARLYGYAAIAGHNPRPTSIFRDPTKQRALQAQYDALPGNGPKKPGFLARPATTSLHSETGFLGKGASRAMDMPSNNDPAIAAIARSLGLGTGAGFKSPDPGHYFTP